MPNNGKERNKNIFDGYTYVVKDRHPEYEYVFYKFYYLNLKKDFFTFL